MTARCPFPELMSEPRTYYVWSAAPGLYVARVMAGHTGLLVTAEKDFEKLSVDPPDIREARAVAVTLAGAQKIADDLKAKGHGSGAFWVMDGGTAALMTSATGPDEEDGA